MISIFHDHTFDGKSAPPLEGVDEFGIVGGGVEEDRMSDD